jgi:hypothetical protein
MRLTTTQGYDLLEKHGAYIAELCDACGQGIGPIRFTRRGDAGVWCSRECRGGKDTYVPGTCRECRAALPRGKRRGSVFCDDACKQARHRSKPVLQRPRPGKLSVTNRSIYAAFSPKNTGDGVRSHPGASSCVLGDIGCSA